MSGSACSTIRVRGENSTWAWDSGPRGFRNHAFTGDRAVNTTAEYRYMAALDFLKMLDLGIATFVDWGGAWYRGSERRTGWDTGIGLRIGPSRATGIDLSRIDLVYRGRTDRDDPGWLVVIGRGLVFLDGRRSSRGTRRQATGDRR